MGVQSVRPRFHFRQRRHGQPGCNPPLSTSQRSAPDLLISKQRIGQVSGHRTGPDQARAGAQTLCFSSRPFVLCGLPVGACRRPTAVRAPQRSVRSSGHGASRVRRSVRTGPDRADLPGHARRPAEDPDHSLPQPQPRCSRAFGMHKGGKEYRRLVAAFERIFGATIFFGTDSLTGQAKVVQRSRFNFMSEAKIWYDRHAGQRSDRVREYHRAQRRVLSGGDRPPGAERSRGGEGAGRLAGGSRPLHVAFVPLLQGKGSRKRFRSSGRTASLANWARWSTRDLAGSGRCWSSGSDRFGPCGRSARHGSAKMEPRF